MKRAQSQRFMVVAGLAAMLAVFVATVCVWRFTHVQRDMVEALAGCECCEEPGR